MYKQRLRWRALRKRTLELAPEARTSLTSYATDHFASGTAPASPLAIERPDTERNLETFDPVAASAEWDWSRRITIPRTDPGEPTQDATVVRFVGRSWMPMTEDHRPLRLLQTGNDRTRSGVENVNLIDLHPGTRIIVKREERETSSGQSRRTPAARKNMNYFVSAPRCGVRRSNREDQMPRRLPKDWQAAGSIDTS